MRSLPALAMLVATLGLGACSGDATLSSPFGEDGPDTAGTDPLTAAQIRLFLQDSTLTEAGEERDRHIYLAPDGRLFGAAVGRRDRSRREVRGTWTVIEDGLLCRDWQTDWAGDRPGCDRVYRFGDAYLFVSRNTGGNEQRREIRRTRRPGNVQKL